MTEALSPTVERLRKGDAFQGPAKDQKTDRVAWRALSALTVLLHRQEIEREHFEAAQKFQKHMLGSLGFDVRLSTDSRSGDEPLEFPRSYHAQMVAKVRDHLTPREFTIIERITADESTPVSIGFGLSGHGTHQQAKPYGVSAINSALDRLAYFFGFKRREPPRA
ncbi:MAG: hypothetical protein BVN33_14830 [Proteobacteria bacterium ST_bin13]|nr:MAG: hypothetical protein BVN33_14830 [Proteobacteria bacterium ST_bin13]